MSVTDKLCELAAANQRLRTAVTALAALVQRDRVALYEAHRNPDTGEVDAAERRGLIDCGMSLRGGWLTKNGEALLAGTERG